jgi:hypothetical protein
MTELVAAADVLFSISIFVAHAYDADALKVRPPPTSHSLIHTCKSPGQKPGFCISTRPRAEQADRS